MVSIEAYRARIGMFRAGKVKQTGFFHGFDQELLKNNDKSEKFNIIQFGWKVCYFAMMFS